MRRLIEAVDSDTSKTKVDEALPLLGAAAAAARVAAPYVARAGSAIMKGLKGPAKPPATPPKPPVTPPTTTPAGATPPIPANVNIPAVVRNKPATPAPSAPPSAPTSPTTAGAKPPTKTDTIPAVTKPKIERRPGETTADAVKRAQAEKGVAPKPEAPKPAAGEKPAVWRDPRTGEISSTPPGAGKPTAPKPASGNDPVGSARPGGAKDIYGRREPGSVDNPEPIGPETKPAKKGIKKALAAATALHLGGAYLYDKFGNKIPKGSVDPERQPVGGSPTGNQQPIQITLPPEQPDTTGPSAAPAARSSNIDVDVPYVGPQGPDSPFYVITPSSSGGAPANVTSVPPPAAATTPANVSPSTSSQSANTSKSTSATPAANTGLGGSGGSSSASPGAGSEDEQIERNLRRMGVIKETLSQRLLNDFINYIESNSKSKAK